MEIKGRGQLVQSLGEWDLAVRKGAAHPFTMMFLIPWSHKNCMQEKGQITLQYLHCNTVYSFRRAGHVLCHIVIPVGT